LAASFEAGLAAMLAKQSTMIAFRREAVEKLVLFDGNLGGAIGRRC
jgi:hypothetical protein